MKQIVMYRCTQGENVQIISQTQSLLEGRTQPAFASYRCHFQLLYKCLRLTTRSSLFMKVKSWCQENLGGQTQRRMDMTGCCARVPNLIIAWQGGPILRQNLQKPRLHGHLSLNQTDNPYFLMARSNVLSDKRISQLKA